MLNVCNSNLVLPGPELPHYFLQGSSNGQVFSLKIGHKVVANIVRSPLVMVEDLGYANGQCSEYGTICREQDALAELQGWG